MKGIWIVAPGGSIVEDSTDPEKLFRTNVCVFGTDESRLREFYEASQSNLNR